MARAFAPAIFGLLGLSLGLVACGGEDQGRPSGARDVAPKVDECEAVGERYELSDIIRFEDVGSSRPSACESSLTTSSGQPSSCSFYFNYDEDRTVTDQDGDGPADVAEG